MYFQFILEKLTKDDSNPLKRFCKIIHIYSKLVASILKFLTSVCL